MEEFSEKRGIQALLAISEVVAVALKAYGIAEKLSKEIGLDVAEVVRNNHGGEQIYIPKGLALVVGKRDREIFAEFDGNNHFALAKKHDLTVRQIYNVIARVRAEDFAKRQMNLFG